ncbi:helix-turn-helix domain-containing protein [Streptomyces sp. Ju416(a)]|uniref:helix-turn-helix domain-containing protein n=1 Tax=Streptomyces sp. Ju416(a) TaxID=3446591 RepID=UPI00403D7046
MTTQPERDLRAQVKAALTTARISQAEAARQLDLSTKHMSQMLTGRATLTLDWADRILTLCGMTLAVVAAPAANQSRPTQPRISLDDLTSDALDQLYADLDRYKEVVGDLNEANTGLQRQAARAAATVARVRQAVDAGPVGSCCAHLIRAALNPAPAVKRCGCGRPDPGPCQPCPNGSPSLHCACECAPAEGAA